MTLYVFINDKDSQVVESVKNVCSQLGSTGWIGGGFLAGLFQPQIGKHQHVLITRGPFPLVLIAGPVAGGVIWEGS